MKHLITIAILFFALNTVAQATDAKIYVKGNYFFIEKDNYIYEGLSKEVLVKKQTPTSTEFFFSNVNNWLGQGIELVNILDESGTAYTAASWETFYIENTGSFSNGGGSGVGLNWISNTGGGVYAVNDIVNYSGVLYKNLTGVNTDTSPDTDTTNWEVLPSGETSVIKKEVSNIINASINTSWTPRAVTEQNSWFSTTYGNGLYVAVAINGTNRIAYSKDGVNWNVAVAPEQNNWDSVTFGNGLFVAVSTNGTNRIMTSPDGINWTARASTEQNDWFSVTYGDGTFVALSSNGTNRVMTSPDGITWTSRAAASASGWINVTYGNGQFVAVAIAGTSRVMTSPDGITWTSRTAAAANQWRGVIYGNGMFVAVSNTGTNRVMTSPDGITWTSRSATEQNSWYSVAYGDGVFMAIAGDGTNRAMMSHDGITWLPTNIDSNLWVYVAYGNGKFVAVSYDGTDRITTIETPPIAVTNRSYALTNTANIDSFWGTITGLEENDVVTYDGTNWNISLDVSTQVETGSYQIFNKADDLIYFYNGSKWSLFEDYKIDARPNGILKDSNGNAGTSTQVLSSTGAGTEWVDAASGLVDSGWQTPTLLNGWSDFGDGWQEARYRKIGNRVTIEGLVKDGALPNSDIFSLPAGYRPTKSLLFRQVAETGDYVLTVNASGDVNLSSATGGGNAYVSISTTYLVD